MAIEFAVLTPGSASDIAHLLGTHNILFDPSVQYGHYHDTAVLRKQALLVGDSKLGGTPYVDFYVRDNFGDSNMVPRYLFMFLFVFAPSHYHFIVKIKYNNYIFILEPPDACVGVLIFSHSEYSLVVTPQQIFLEITSTKISPI